MYFDTKDKASISVELMDHYGRTFETYDCDSDLVLLDLTGYSVGSYIISTISDNEKPVQRVACEIS